MPLYAITGATGQLGRLVIDELLRTIQPEQIVAIARDTTKASALAAKGVTVRIAEYSDPTALRSALQGVDKLLLISGSEVGQRIKQHRNIVDAAQANGVAHIAYTSILHADTTPHILASEHKATEDYIKASGLVYSFLRHGWYSEMFEDAARTALESGRLVTAAGDGRIASAARADYAVGDAAILLGNAGSQAYEFAGDYAWSYGEFAETLSRISGKPVVCQKLDAVEYIATLTAAGATPEAAQFRAALDANVAEGTLAETGGELSKLIGRPTTPLETTLRNLLSL